MVDVLEILKLIEQGNNTNAPADIIVQVIKQYCETVINAIEQQTEGGKND